MVSIRAVPSDFKTPKLARDDRTEAKRRVSGRFPAIQRKKLGISFAPYSSADSLNP
jgi:hypothetical protein